MKRFTFLAAALAVAVPAARSASFDAAAAATNGLGLDLYRKIATGADNVCLSPYSISCALAMTLDGAAGETRREMERVLHLAQNEKSDASFAALQKSLGEIGPRTAEIAAQAKVNGGPSEQIVIAVANRLFAQESFEFRAQFFAEVKENFAAAPASVDFKNDPGAATEKINRWVAQQTRDRIEDLIANPLSSDTRLVLANALYLKAPWAKEFSASATAPEPFHVRGASAIDVPMMRKQETLGYAKRDGFSIVAIPYSGGDLQFVIFLPDQIDGWRTLESKLSTKLLAECAKLPQTVVALHFPKFKFAPPTMQLAKTLEDLGMKRAFDIPPGSANFERMAPRRPNDYLAISDVFHKTFIDVDEHGTEAAAATAVTMVLATAMQPPSQPIEVKVDRPFLYAIEHVPSGACLFIGRVTDPR